MISEKCYRYTIYYAGKHILTKGVIQQTIETTESEIMQEITKTAKLLNAEYYDLEKEYTGRMVVKIDLPQLKEKQNDTNDKTRTN